MIDSRNASSSPTYASTSPRSSALRRQRMSPRVTPHATAHLNMSAKSAASASDTVRGHGLAQEVAQPDRVVEPPGGDHQLTGDAQRQLWYRIERTPSQLGVGRVDRPRALRSSSTTARPDGIPRPRGEPPTDSGCRTRRSPPRRSAPARCHHRCERTGTARRDAVLDYQEFLSRLGGDRRRALKLHPPGALDDLEVLSPRAADLALRRRPVTGRTRGVAGFRTAARPARFRPCPSSLHYADLIYRDDRTPPAAMLASCAWGVGQSERPCFAEPWSGAYPGVLGPRRGQVEPMKRGGLNCDGRTRI